ncbi:MAG: hypothetical protein Q4Q62_07990 [Thermoplasmata archaeon]|nr:hypothetical protein [Thermoplasmata archaeon]
MRWLEERRARRQQQAKKMRDDAVRIMETIESPYVDAKERLSAYERSVRFRPGAAYRAAKRAYRAAVDESEAARKHIEAVEILSAQKRMTEKRIARMDASYRISLANGNARKAAGIADRMYRIASYNPDPSIIKVTMDATMSDDGAAEILLTNRNRKPVIVNKVSCTSGSRDVAVQEGMAEACQPGQQVSRRLEFDGDASLGVTVYVEYEQDYETFKIRRHLSLMKQV